MERLRFFMELVDKISGPAAKVRKSLDVVDKKLRGSRGWQFFSKSVANGAKTMSGAVSSFFGNVGAQVVGQVTNMAASAASATVDLMAFKDATLRSFTTLTGSAAAANALFARTVSLATTLGQSPKEALEGVTELLGKGFKGDEALTILQGMADLKTISPKANIGNLLLAIGQVKSKGVLQMEELQGQIAEAGLGVAPVLDQIAKQIGIKGATIEERTAKVRAAISAGQVSANTGILGVLNAIQDLGGGKPLGSLTVEGRDSLSGLLTQLKALPEQFILRLDSKGMEPVRNMLRDIVNMLNPETESGAKLVATFGELVRMVAIATAAFGGGFMKAVQAMFKNFDTGAKGTEKLQKFMGALGAVLGFIGSMLVYATIGFGALAYAIGWVAMKVGEFFTGVWAKIQQALAWVKDFKETARAWGSAVIDGFVAGWKAKIRSVVEAIKGLTDMLPEAVKKALGIASPSKVFAELGAFTVQGFNVGMQSEAANTNALMTELVAPPAGSAMGGGTTVTGGPVNIVIHAGAGASAEDIARQVRRELLRMHEDLALAVGT